MVDEVSAYEKLAADARNRDNDRENARLRGGWRARAIRHGSHELIQVGEVFYVVPYNEHDYALTELDLRQRSTAVFNVHGEVLKNRE